MRTKNVIVSLAFVVALGGACGGRGDEPEPEASGGNVDAAGTVVSIKDFTFAPAEIEVKAGTTVRWENADAFLHTVTSGATSGPENEPDGRFDEELPDAGSDAEVTFEEPGTYTYYCRQHNAMDGTITVA